MLKDWWHIQDLYWVFDWEILDAKKVTYVVWTGKKFQTVNLVYDSVEKGDFFSLFCFVLFFNNLIQARANWKGEP